MKTLSHLFVLVALLLGGCAGHSDYMAPVPPERATFTPASDKAMVVFMRPSGLGFAIQSSVFDVTEAGDPKFIAIVSAKKKVAHEVRPGTYRFMVIGENASFLDATVAAGKTYYTLIEPRMGFWKARFAFEPILQARLPSTDFKEWFAECAWMENTPAALAWAKNNMSSVKEKKNDYLSDWAQETDKATLQATDGK